MLTNICKIDIKIQFRVFAQDFTTNLVKLGTNNDLGGIQEEDNIDDMKQVTCEPS